MSKERYTAAIKYAASVTESVTDGDIRWARMTRAKNSFIAGAGWQSAEQKVLHEELSVLREKLNKQENLLFECSQLIRRSLLKVPDWENILEITRDELNRILEIK